MLLTEATPEWPGFTLPTTDLPSQRILVDLSIQEHQFSGLVAATIYLSTGPGGKRAAAAEGPSRLQC